MTEQHPITPPPELVQEWCDEWYRLKVRINTGIPEYVATQAARWGFRQCIKVDAARLEDKLQKARDQELEECCEWLREARNHGFGYDMGRILADNLRAVRRPKPPSLAEQALAKTEAILNDPSRVLLTEEREALELNRRALERLQELEQENNG